MSFFRNNVEFKEVRQLAISKELLNYVADGDYHMILEDIEYSTNLREIVTVGYMVEHPIVVESEVN